MVNRTGYVYSILDNIHSSFETIMMVTFLAWVVAGLGIGVLWLACACGDVEGDEAKTSRNRLMLNSS